MYIKNNAFKKFRPDPTRGSTRPVSIPGPGAAEWLHKVAVGFDSDTLVIR